MITWNTLVLYLLIVGKVAIAASPFHQVVGAAPASGTVAVNETVGLGVGDDAVTTVIVAVGAVCPHPKEVSVDANPVASPTVKTEEVSIALTHNIFCKILLTCQISNTH